MNGSMNEWMDFPKNPGGYRQRLTPKYYRCWRWHVCNGRHNNTGWATFNCDRNPQCLIFTLVVTFYLLHCFSTVRLKITETDEMLITVT
jgi:hypothetical protein